MRVTSHNRLDVARALDDIRVAHRRTFAAVPTWVETAFDPDTQSGMDVSDGDGLGRAVTWTVYELYCRVQVVDSNLVTFGHIPSGVQTGDYVFGIQPRDLEVINAVIHSEHAYLSIDGEIFRPIDAEVGAIGQVTEYIVGARKFQPASFAPGLRG